jgi:hypothetical protein
MTENTSNGDHGKPQDSRVLFLEQLVEGRADIAADIVEVDPQTWAVHGVIPVGGDVIMAEFDSRAEAKAALHELAAKRGAPTIANGAADRSTT